MDTRLRRVSAGCFLSWSLGLGLVAVGPLSAQDPAPGSGSVEQNAQSPEVQNAILKFRNQQFDEARAALVEARVKDPKLPPPDVVMASLFRSGNNLPQTVAYLEKAIVNEPTDPEAFLSLATLDLQQQRMTSAALLFEQGNTLAKSFSGDANRKKELLQRAAQGLATAAESRLDWKAAEEHLRTMLAGNPNDPNVATRLGRALFNQKSAEKVKEAYKKFQELYEAKKSEVSHPDVIMATLFQQADDSKRAQAFVREAIKKDGKNPTTRLAVVRYALDSRDLKMADENLKAAREVDKTSFESNFYAGLLARYQGNFPEAEKYFTMAHVQKPSNNQVIHHLALVLIEQPGEEKQQLALEYAELNARANSDVALQPVRESLVTLGWVLHRAGRDGQVDSIIQRAFQGGGIGSESGYHAAKILIARGRTDIAQKILEESLKAKAAFVDRPDAEKVLKELTGQ
ncbi:MAG: hypothetical protein O3C60_07720 [Planctomycetota bacterium]|nr:hypothetical protein [Planctomycetota bacterium]